MNSIPASALPIVITFVVPGRDNPGNGIVATFTVWGDNWAWQVQYATPEISSRYMSHHIASTFSSLPNHGVIVTDLPL